MKKRILYFIGCLMLLMLATSLSDQLSAQVTYTESFDTTQFLPPGWTPVGSTTSWSRRTTGTTPTCLPHSGAAMARFSRTPNNTIQTFSSPVVDYSNRGVDTPRVSFWIYRDNGAPANNDFITVFVNSTPDLNGASQVGMVFRSRVINTPDTQAVNGWYKYSFDIPAGFNSATNYLLFRGANDITQGNNIFIDDIQYTAFPTPCSGSPSAGIISAHDSIICGGTGSTTLTLHGQGTQVGITHHWKSGPSATGPWAGFGSNVTSISTGPITTTTYYYCVSTCGNSLLSDSTPVIHVVVDPNAAPSVNVTASNNGNVCANQPVTLTATGALVYNWSPSTGLDTTAGSVVMAAPTGAPGATTTYTVIGANAAGCTSRDSIQLTNHSTTTVTIQATPPNDTLCSGQTLTLNTTNGGGPGITGYLWAPGGETTQSITDNPTSNTTYHVTATNNWGCTSQDSVHIVISTGTIPTINTLTASNNGLYCVGGDSVMLVVSGSPGTYATWTPATGLNTTSGDTVLSVAQGGGFGGGNVLYTVSLTNPGGCSASDTIRVRRSNRPNATVQVTPNDTICAGTPVTMNVQVFGFGGNTFLWHPGLDTNQSITVTPTANILYTVNVTSNTTGCSRLDSVNLHVTSGINASFNYSISGTIVTFTNTSSGASSYSWNFGDLSNSTSPTPPPHIYGDTGTYVVTLAIANGSCRDTVFQSFHIGPVGINELNANNEIVVSPNPTHGITTIEFISGQSNGLIQVVNSLGQVVVEKTATSKGNRYDKEEINLSEFPAGVYMIHIDTGQKKISRRIVKQ